LPVTPRAPRPPANPPNVSGRGPIGSHQLAAKSDLLSQKAFGSTRPLPSKNPAATIIARNWKRRSPPRRAKLDRLAGVHFASGLMKHRVPFVVTELGFKRQAPVRNSNQWRSRVRTSMSGVYHPPTPLPCIDDGAPPGWCACLIVRANFCGSNFGNALTGAQIQSLVFAEDWR
jgi:hypothetical protein